MMKLKYGIRNLFFGTKKISMITIAFFAISFTAAMLFGCTSVGTFKEAHDGAVRNGSNIQRLKQIENTEATPVKAEKGYYYDVDPIDSQDRPSWLRNRINVNGQRIPLAFLVSRILRNTNVLVKYQPGVQKNWPISVNYTGTIKGALDEIATRTNYTFEVDGTELIWQAFVTKTFNISFMPGSATYVVGQTSSASSSSSGGGGSAAETSTTGNLISKDQQYSGLQAASLSVWEDLRKTLDQLKSPDGKVSVSEATTMVTVYDRPSNVEAIGRYIDQLNQNMSRQVRLKVQVLEIDLDKEHNFGLDWNSLQQWFGQKFSIAGKLGTATNVAGAISGGGASSAFSPSTLTIGPVGGNNVILNALSTQGKLSIITEPTVVTMNNQVAEIRIANDTSYLQNVSTTTDQQNVTTALTPGVVTDGFILYLLPKIKDGQVYLQVSSTLSSLISLNTVDSSGGVNVSNPNKPLNAIQIPTLSEKRFNIRSLVGNNSTLIIGGFKEARDQTRISKLFGIKELGGQGAKVTNTEMILLITPTIIENEANANT